MLLFNLLKMLPRLCILRTLISVLLFFKLQEENLLILISLMSRQDVLQVVVVESDHLNGYECKMAD